MKSKLILAGTLALFSISIASAHSGATGVVKQRMDAMSEIGANMKIIGNMARGTSTMDTEALAASLAAISQNTSGLSDLFPTGTEAAPSEASPAIWENPEDFGAQIDGLETAANTFLLSVQSGKEFDLNASFRSLSKTCKSCHGDYRIKRD